MRLCAHCEHFIPVECDLDGIWTGMCELTEQPVSAMRYKCLVENKREECKDGNKQGA